MITCNLCLEWVGSRKERAKIFHSVLSSGTSETRGPQFSPGLPNRLPRNTLLWSIFSQTGGCIRKAEDPGAFKTLQGKGDTLGVLHGGLETNRLRLMSAPAPDWTTLKLCQAGMISVHFSWDCCE